MDSAKEREVLEAVMRRHLDQLQQAAGEKWTLADLEQVLLDREGPLLRDLLQTLIEHRQDGDFPPSGEDRPA